MDKHGDASAVTLSDLLAPRLAPLDVVRPADVGGAAAWQTLVREGVLQVLRDDAACPAYLDVDPVLRAGLLAGAVPTGATVTARTAAWVHTGFGDAQALDLTYPAGRHQPDRPPGARLWQGPLLGDDTVHLAGIPVTAPERTVVELVLHDDDPVMAVLALMHHGADLGRARRSLELRTRAVGRPRARALLDDVTAALAAGATAA